MKYLTLIPLYIILSKADAQTISGTVLDQNNEPLIGATIQEIGTGNGTISNLEGKFTLTLKANNTPLIVSFSGFESDTIFTHDHSPNIIVLHENTAELEEVVVSASSTFIDNLSSLHTEVITEVELTKAACCNLSESFETNASVDVSITDAISGAKTIKMLGMDGRYVQINRENIPNIRGLLASNGLSFIAGTWIQTIDVGKGAGSVVNGYESMTGQINVELKKPENSEKLYLNTYANTFGRLEFNINHATKLSDRWHGGLLLHADYLANEIDQNEDGFLDIPKSRQLNVMNRYSYQGEKVVSQIGINVLRNQKVGGQLGFDFQDDTETSQDYGFKNITSRAEVFGKVGLLFHHAPYKGWGFIYSASYMDVTNGFGRKSYAGKETTLYANLIHQNIIRNSFHQYKTGISFLYDNYDESYKDLTSDTDTTLRRKELVPGLYYEYTYKPSEKMSLVLGGRTDYHNLYGLYFTPRLHSKYQLAENTTMRLAIGKGYRTPNPIVENNNVLVSSRRLVLEETIQPEVTWNMGGSFVTAFNLKDKALDLVIDYFYTSFKNQLIADIDAAADELRIYNLTGKSFAHSLQIEWNYQFSERLSAKTAYKYYDVKTTIDNQLRQVPFNPKNRFFLNLEYATKFDKWKVDYTLLWFGKQRLPDTSDNPVEFQRASNSPHYFRMNAQISRGFRWGSVYLGSENLSNFTQDNPIIDAENPFGNNFDASIVWAPIAGRMIYAGLKYKLKN